MSFAEHNLLQRCVTLDCDGQRSLAGLVQLGELHAAGATEAVSSVASAEPMPCLCADIRSRANRSTGNAAPTPARAVAAVASERSWIRADAFTSERERLACVERRERFRRART